MLAGCGATSISPNDNMVTTNTTGLSKAPVNSKTIINDESAYETTITESDYIIEESTTVVEATTATTEQISTSQPEIIPKDTIGTENTDDIIEKINEAFFSVRNSGALYSVKVISIDDSTNFGAGNCDTQMISASLIKLYVAGAVYENYNGVKEYENYFGETEYLLDIMISQSDNDACNTLVTRLGNGDSANGMFMVNSFCSTHGFNGTKMNRLMLDFNGLENYTTPTDCCKILKSYYQNELPGSESIISFMKNQVTRTKIPAGIPDGTVVANKSGELSTVENDAAIIYAKSGTYIMCAMTNGLLDTASARKAIAMASEYIFYYMCN